MLGGGRRRRPNPLNTRKAWSQIRRTLKKSSTRAARNRGPCMPSQEILAILWPVGCTANRPTGRCHTPTPTPCLEPPRMPISRTTSQAPTILRLGTILLAKWGLLVVALALPNTRTTWRIWTGPYCLQGTTRRASCRADILTWPRDRTHLATCPSTMSLTAVAEASE